MHKTMILLLISALFSNCQNQKSDSNNNSIKNSGSNNPNSRSFAYETYKPAGKPQCENGGWELSPTAAMNRLDTKIATAKSLTVCISKEKEPKLKDNEVPEPQGMPTISISGEIPKDEFKAAFADICKKDPIRVCLQIGKLVLNQKNYSKLM